MRQDRKWASAWSPEQISNRLRIDFPDDESMRISHEAIYQALHVQGRGALRRELTVCLRSGRALRVPRARVRGRGKSFVTDQIMISERPAEAEDRAVPGHWEGDLILGANQTAIGTLVERSTRFTMLLHLLPMPDHGGPRVKNGPPLAGRGAEAVRDAITAQITTLPEQLRRSLTWDQGAEMTQHAKLTIDSGLQVYFCDPQSPWQRGTNGEHQRPAAPILPQRHEPRQTHRRGARGGRCNAQQQTTQDARLAHTSRGARRASTIPSTANRCEHRLNPPSSRRGCSARRSTTLAWRRRWGPSAPRSIMRWSRPSGPACKSSFSTANDGRPASSSRPRCTTTSRSGTTPEDATAP
jgi:hypothetical protein